MHAEDLRRAIRTHMPELDALRGFAILWVIYHNAARDGTGDARNLVVSVFDLVANMGWMGVQLFFVLSGFLITGILLDGRGADNQFRNFYARRTLRIFPVYYVFLLMIFVVLPYLGIVTWSDKIHIERLWDWTYLVNWVLPFVPDPQLPHLWSLAVEEQYYLLWPLLVVFLRQRILVYVCSALIISAILVRAYLVFHFEKEFADNAMYYFTVARWDTLAIGSLLAMAVRNDKAIAFLQRYFMRAFVGLSLVLMMQITVLHNMSQYQVVGIVNQTSSALWFAMLLLLSIVPWNSQLDALRPLFSSRRLRWVGKYSYAMYIFHFPLKYVWFHFFSIPLPPDAPWLRLGDIAYNFLGITAMTIAAAYLSWHLVEYPFLRLKKYFVLQRRTVPQESSR